MQKLTQRWADTRTGWDDAVADRFQERWLEPLESELRNAMAAMDYMGILISTIRRDCE